MLKYTTTQVAFREIPDEITLCINISNCPIKCPNCHSKELWDDIGTNLTSWELKRLIDENKGISCVCLMGGDSDYESLKELLTWFKSHYKDLKIALYSGRENLDLLSIKAGYWISNFDYVKVGSYKEEYGGLDNPKTNQKLYKRFYPAMAFGLEDLFENITYKFWTNDTNIS